MIYHAHRAQGAVPDGVCVNKSVACRNMQGPRCSCDGASSRFVGLDVCKTHKGWYAASIENLRFLPSSWIPSQCVQIRILEPTWMYATICQPTKRGKARRRYYYSDISMLVVRTNLAVDSNNGGCFSTFLVPATIPTQVHIRVVS